jgi:hypothetical protein
VRDQGRALGAGRAAEKRIYVTFAVSGVSGTVEEARLRLYISEGTRNGLAIYRTASNGWNERQITWADQPGVVGAPLGRVGITLAGCS